MLVHYSTHHMTTVKQKSTAPKPEGRPVQLVLVALAFNLIHYVTENF